MGLNSTLDMISSEFTWNRLRDRSLNLATLGAYGSVNTIMGLYGIAKNIPNYTRNDYIYAGGFLAEKAIEIYVFKKLSGLRMSKGTVAAAEMATPSSGPLKNISGSIKQCCNSC